MTNIPEVARMSGLTVAFMVGAAAGFAAVVWYRAMRREVR